jgi:NTP pyrophosphatase (non-canonical NTP hydrolase)
MSNDLTPAQIERLAWLNEELHEVGQAIGKIMRHGYFSWDPTNPGVSDNKTDLEREIRDVIKAISLLAQKGDIAFEFNQHNDIIKMKYGHYN